MTPKEKAKELFDKFIPLVEAYSSEGQSDNTKQCALIAVDEIIDTKCLGSLILEYWNEVKQEINNL